MPKQHQTLVEVLFWRARSQAIQGEAEVKDLTFLWKFLVSERMENLAHNRYSETEYLELERKSSTKNEYYKGEMFAMAGANRRHNLLVTNLCSVLSFSLQEKPCEVYPSDMKVQNQAESFYTYPDVSIVCGKPEFLNEKEDVLLNPFLIVEVLSKSTEKYDRGAKFSLCRSIASLQEYILVHTDERKIESFRRKEEGWLFCESVANTVFPLLSLGINLEMDSVYNKIEFPAKTLREAYGSVEEL